VDVRYLTARFKRSHDWTGPSSSMSRYTPQFPSDGLAIAVGHAIEDHQWAVMFGWFGAAGERRTVEDLVTQCRRMPPFYREAVSGEMIGEAVSFRHPDSRRRRLEALDRFPARLVAVGDAVASFNPVYGQGMSSAALHGSCLSEYLRSEPDLATPARHFFALQKVVVDAAWQVSTAADAARLGLVRRPTTLPDRLRAWTAGQVLAATNRDVRVAEAFRAVSFMTAHPTTLRAPSVVARALRANWRARAAGSPARV
jgi:2-polyprenyl-6-methoxyphenol hydroxylase-like FAD-dependent oxidoreductase